MATAASTEPDPLIATLPPQTDYITYLTLLEYQLTPDNLPTLNKLLSDDDGTLAAEIGWDLFRLVLPMLGEAPEAARSCLEIISRRGNPREVVVRVSEELEKIGDEEADDDDWSDEEESGKQKVFAGEAAPVHLGEMKLQGMPETRNRRRSSSAAALDPNVKLQALLSMLSHLHPRIRTQYPSRFLATSLPPALRAFRILPVTSETTASFLSFISKLAGKQRPPLPPRTSTAGSTTSLSAARMQEASNRAATLPDPESKNSPQDAQKAPSENEKAIFTRLLQAVLLEVLDEYTSSFSSTQTPSLQWTSRIRARYEPKFLPSYRSTELDKWAVDPVLVKRETMISQIIKLGRDLGLDVVNEIKLLRDSKRRDSRNTRDEEEEEPEHEYPSSPSEVPLSTTGLVLLYAAQSFASSMQTSTKKQPLAVDSISLFARLRSSNPDPSIAATDAILSLLYTDVQPPSNNPDQQALKYTFRRLEDTFITSPDPSVRDNAHYVATLYLHSSCTRATRLALITDMLKPSTSPTNPIHAIQSGNLKAIAIDWLKDEMYPSEHIRTIIERSSKSIEESQRGLSTNTLDENPAITQLIYPVDIPAPPSAGDHDPDSLEPFLLNIPYHISGLNLLCLIAASTVTAPPIDPAKSTIAAAQPTLLQLEKWRDLLVNMADVVSNKRKSETQSQLQVQKGGPGDDGDDARGGGRGPTSAIHEDEIGMNLSDVYALEDAVNRAREAVEALNLNNAEDAV